MKKCNVCQALLDDQATACVMCGSADLCEVTADTQQPEQTEPTQLDGQYYEGENQAEAAVVTQEDNGNGNILAGIVGAFLFSIIGGILYFLIYQAGIIAGICGLVIFVLANFGYGLFAQTKNKNSLAGLISAIIATVIMIFLAEYICLSYEIFRVYEEVGITIFDAIRATPDFLAEPDVSAAVIKDLAFAYIFGFIASISNIMNIVKARKNKQ